MGPDPGTNIPREVCCFCEVMTINVSANTAAITMALLVVLAGRQETTALPLGDERGGHSTFGLQPTRGTSLAGNRQAVFSPGAGGGTLATKQYNRLRGT